jgi:hypothetical protein
MMSVSRNQHAVLWRAWQDSGENLNDIARKAGQDYKAVWRLLRLIKSQSTDRETQAPTLQGVLFALGHPMKFEDFKHIPDPINGADEVALIYAYRRLRQYRPKRAYGAVRDIQSWAKEAEEQAAKDARMPDEVEWEDLLTPPAPVVHLQAVKPQAQLPAPKKNERRARSAKKSAK